MKSKHPIFTQQLFGPTEPDPIFHVLLMSTFPPRECGLATFSKDLIESIQSKFHRSCHIEICAIDHSESNTKYPKIVRHILHSDELASYARLAQKLNDSKTYDCILLQHEFGLFGGDYGTFLLDFLKHIQIPVITTFHTVLPNPSSGRKHVVQGIIESSHEIICMTNASCRILMEDYHCPKNKLSMIPHGTHLLGLKSSDQLKKKFGFNGRKTLSTFGLLSSGKSIETGLLAVAEVVKKHPEILYLIIGKTHPEIIKKEGEKYRNYLQQYSIDLGIENHVHFVNEFVERKTLQEYLQATDIYLFTSTDPFQAVSGTFSYAMASGCPIISTRIPQAEDMLGSAGILVDFQAPTQMAEAIGSLIGNEHRLKEMKGNALQQIRPSAWQNVAIKHLKLIEKHSVKELPIIAYSIPEYNLNHFQNTTTELGMIQFCQAETPLESSGYTLDDNARALISLVEYYELTQDSGVLASIRTHFQFILNMQQANGSFLNYRDQDGKISDQNFREDLTDSNGRAIWALGELMFRNPLFDASYVEQIRRVISKCIHNISQFKSPRSISFCIKGLVRYNAIYKSHDLDLLIAKLAQKLVDLYEKNSDKQHNWFEAKLTYANAVIPEALLLAHRNSGSLAFKKIALESFDYLCSILFCADYFRVISNKTWHEPGKETDTSGEQPIDVAYTIIALSEFYESFGNYSYLLKMKKAFEWYLGRNQLNQIVYNPISGGCLDGIESEQVNINQGAEATTTYLMARNRMERHHRKMEQGAQRLTHTHFKFTHPYAAHQNFFFSKS